MRFIDEKYMWYAETEYLATELANKTEQEVMDILNQHDIIRLDTMERKSTHTFGRILLVVLYPFLVLLACIKWVLTGDRYLDSWSKRLHLEKFFKFCGIK